MWSTSSKPKSSKISDKNEVYNEFVPGSQETGYSPIYRQKGVTHVESTLEPEMKTVKDMLERTLKTYGEKPGFGQVLVNIEKNEEGADVEKRVVIDYSYRHIYEQAMRLGKAMHDRKMYSKETERRMNLVGIFSKNRLEWFQVDWACVLFGYTLTPLYDTLGKENLGYCLNESRITTLFVSSQTAAELFKFNERGNLKTLVLFDEIDLQLRNNLIGQGLELVNYWELIEEGSKSGTTNKDIHVKPEDIYSFCYTSGTTGPPKGALISHGNMMASNVGFIRHKELGLGPNDRYLSYLPLPHLMERAVTMASFYAGSQIIISCGNPMKLKEDCCVTKTTVLISVPRLYNRIVEGVKATINSIVDDENQRKIIQSNVFAKTRQAFGGSVRVMASGSAPLNPATHEYMQNIMGCPLIEGYGQTESPTAVFLSRPTETLFGMMHELTPSTEVRLMDIPEMKYTAEDKNEKGQWTPRGELCIHGPQVFQGYYKMQDITKETIDQKGWLHTGDVCEVTPTLAFKIIDRKKNIFKLQQGEYVAPDKVENVYARSGLVEEVFLHGTSSCNYAVAIVVPKKDKLAQIIKNLGIQGDIPEAAKAIQVRTQYLAELNDYARKQGVFGFQVAKNIAFQFSGFAVRGILTNTMKLIRFQARKVYKHQIDEMYEQGELKL